MHITINLDTTDDGDLAALAALVRSLGGWTELKAETIDGTLEQVRFDAPFVEAEPSIPDAPSVLPEPPAHGPDEYAANPEGAPDTDSRGLPWDERIHAGTKATNADGTWRYRRSVDKELVASVEAELRGAELPEPPAAEGPEPASVPEAPAAAAVPEAPPAEAPEPTAGAPTFKDAMARVTAGQRDGSVTQEQVAAAAQALGLTSVVDLAKPANAHLIEGFIAALG